MGVPRGSIAFLLSWVTVKVARCCNGSQQCSVLYSLFCGSNSRIQHFLDTSTNKIPTNVKPNQEFLSERSDRFSRFLGREAKEKATTVFFWKSNKPVEPWKLKNKHPELKSNNPTTLLLHSQKPVCNVISVVLFVDVSRKYWIRKLGPQNREYGVERFSNANASSCSNKWPREWKRSIL